MIKSFFDQIKQKKKVQTKSCDSLIQLSGKSSLSAPISHSTTKKIYIKDQLEIDNWILYTKPRKLLLPGCRLLQKYYPLIELLGENSIFNKRKRQFVRMFHGTRSQNLVHILKQGLRPVGNGTLGRGFYMTPSLEKALNYTMKQQEAEDRKTFPVILEIFLPNPEKIKVCCIDRTNESSCCPFGHLYTDYDDLWQYVVKDENVLKRFQYNIWIV